MMAKYMIKATYSTEGIKGLMKEGGSGRVKAVTELLDGVGGNLVAVYFAFGGSDAYVIADLPHNVSAAAVAGAVSSSGAFSSYETVVLLPPDQMDQAMQNALVCRSPGG